MTPVPQRGSRDDDRLLRGVDPRQEADHRAVERGRLLEEEAVRATDRCLRILGGYGLVEESPLERLFRDTRLGPFSPISNEMVKNFLGERLGLPRSY